MPPKMAPKEIINRCWKMGTTHIEGSRRGGSGVMVSALSYLLKYVTKLSGWTLTKIDYMDEVIRDLAHRLARLRLMYRNLRRKEVPHAPPLRITS